MNSITLLGLVAATLTTFSFLPQAIKVIKTKNTNDLSLPMYASLTIGIFLWLIYGILMNDIPIIACNSITFIFAAIILAMKVKYK